MSDRFIKQSGRIVIKYPCESGCHALHVMDVHPVDKSAVPHNGSIRATLAMKGKGLVLTIFEGQDHKDTRVEYKKASNQSFNRAMDRIRNHLETVYSLTYGRITHNPDASAYCQAPLSASWLRFQRAVEEYDRAKKAGEDYNFENIFTTYECEMRGHLPLSEDSRQYLKRRELENEIRRGIPEPEPDKYFLVTVSLGQAKPQLRDCSIQQMTVHAPHEGPVRKLESDIRKGPNSDFVLQHYLRDVLKVYPGWGILSFKIDRVFDRDLDELGLKRS